jgi:dihydropyrimidinase
MYGLSGIKGSIAPGYDADLVIWYPSGHEAVSLEKKLRITNEILHHSIDYTPFEGFEVVNWPRYVLLRGEVKFNREVEFAQGHGKGILGQAGDGRFLKRGKGEILTGRVGGGVEPLGMSIGERQAWM